ncbi:lipopolysaccharide biosynthesis protein [Aneurinibacillus thermoaerophilus]|uniref:lipopolysaccharide biosynthesis protein n=1 Tax=Aneurinibacillus thermoaerophilus TaxID=143495 RepID=UPI002E22B888|nr:lipopolysaccharide biosynthesis protein [Aneurinibacillus thermoaerophilus]MED0763911.1 lipopolysaccharide biosynthesis protein [Aneurinibacillus thermoaerophilus]
MNRIAGVQGVVEKIKRRLPKSKFARNVVVLAGGTALAQGLLLLASPILSRLYKPESFGVLAVFTAMLSILVVISSLRYELAILLPEEEETAANVFALSVLVVFGMTLLIGTAVFLFGDTLLLSLKAEKMLPYLFLLPVSFLGLGLYQSLNYWAIRYKRFASISRTKFSQSFGMVCTQILAGLFIKGPAGLLYGDVVGRVSGSGTLALLSWRHDRHILRKISLSGVGKAACRYYRFPLFSSWSGLLNSGGLQLPALILASFYGPQVLGWFALGQRVIGVPMTMIGQSVAQVYTGESSRLARQNPEQLLRLFYQTAKKLFFIGLLPSLLLGIAGPQLFALVFGGIWYEAGRYIQILSFMYLIQFVVFPLSQTLDIIECQHVHLIWQLGRIVLIIAALVSAAWWKAPPALAIGLYGGVMAVGYVILFFLSAMSIRKLCGTDKTAKDVA